ncbi:hypothetical protein AXH09_28805 [Pseudomonas aeruginosa]|nr:hypothetical protein AXH09_28805 [Pseudomonas aeruginosa]
MSTMPRNSASRRWGSFSAASSLAKPSRTAPSRPMAPNSPLGQATVNSGEWKLPAAMAWAPSP